jgi:hypothetical protein
MDETAISQQGEEFVLFAAVNPETMEGDNGVVGEAATPFRGGDFASATNSIFS